jgi:hypothetical protein
MTKDLDPFGPARPPEPSAELRDRVLAVARVSTPLTERQVGIVDRLWESHRVRWGWAFLVFLLVLGHVAISRESPHTSVWVAETPLPEPGTSDPMLADLETPWLGLRPQKPQLSVIDLILDPGAASPGGEKP